jgi:hypothetical protein
VSTLTFNHATHEYKSDGRVIPSVTQILALAGLSDVSAIPAHILENARWKGEEAHKACEYLDQDDLDWKDVFPEILPFVMAYQKFKAEKEFVPELVEHRCEAEVDGLSFGMCVDRTGTIAGVAYVLDLKTSSKAQPSWRIQTAAYKLGLGEKRERGVVHLKKDGTYELLKHTGDEDELIFRLSLQLAHWKLRNGFKIK